jgi:predicted small lipoprotein YifL
MARQTRIAVIVALGAALALGACGRKGPLDPPGAPQEAPEGTPNPAAKPDGVTNPDGTPEPVAKPDAATTLPRPTPVPLAKPDGTQPTP